MSSNSPKSYRNQQSQLQPQDDESVKAKRVTHGFNPITSASSSSALPSPSFATNSAPIGIESSQLRSKPIDISSYKSQIPGWSGEEKSSLFPAKSPGLISSQWQDQKKSLESGVTSSSLFASGYHNHSSSGLSQSVSSSTAPSPFLSGQKTPTLEKSALLQHSSLTSASNTTASDVTTNSGEKPLSKAEKKAAKQAKRAAERVQNPSDQSISQVSARVNKLSGTGNAPQPVTASRANPSQRDRSEKRSMSVAPFSRNTKEVALFSHLVIHTKNSPAPEHARQEMIAKNQDLHPLVVKLGLKYQHYKIIGSNDRCIALLETFRQVIEDYTTPPNVALSRHLDAYIKPQINYLVACRPLSVSMGNAIRCLKLEIASIPTDMHEAEAKRRLDEYILNFIRDRILYADSVIAELASSKIRKNDVILTYGQCWEVDKVPFRVIIVDSRPLMEGRRMLEALSSKGIPCTYVYLNALSYILREVTTVFLGAHALLANGVVMSRVGTAIVAQMAHQRDIPVITCCESYKFSDRVQLDSFVHNELADPEDLVDTGAHLSLSQSVLSHKLADLELSGDNGNYNKKPQQQSNSQPSTQSESNSNINVRESNTLSGWREKPDLKLLHLMYDVTPSEFVSMVITEIGIIPCSSVPVVLREGIKVATKAGRE